MKQLLNKKIFGLMLGSFAAVPAMAATEAETTASSIFDNPLNTILLITAIALFILLVALGYIINKVIGTKELWVNKKFLGVLMIGLFSAYSIPVSAATESAAASVIVDSTTYILIAINVVLLVVVAYLKRLSTQVVQIATGIEPKSASYAPSMKDFTDIVPIEQESEVMTDHEYDGIRELDNNLPPWWVGMFYLSIIFAVIYIPYYHFGGGMLQEQEYEQELADAEEAIAKYMAMKGSMVDETNAELLTSSSALRSGQQVFIASCAACHGQNAEGMVGPNLTDQYWLHGGDIKEIFATIKYGVPDKGMLSWADQLSPVHLHEVSSYILSLQGSNPANAKEPQGDLYDPEAAAAAPADSAHAQ